MLNFSPFVTLGCGNESFWWSDIEEYSTEIQCDRMIVVFFQSPDTEGFVQLHDLTIDVDAQSRLATLRVAV